MTIAGLALAWLTAFLVSIAPAFMPPMWLVLIALQQQFDLPLLPLTLGAAWAGGAGRFVLGRISGAFVSRLPASTRRDTEALGQWFDRRRRHKWPMVMAYFLGPFPSNLPFIALGAGRSDLRGIATCYALARMFSDTLWVWVGIEATQSVRELLSGTYTDWKFLALQFAGLLLMVVLLRLPWGRWIGLR
ncbi:MAG: hypothetical protein AB7J35_09805 [Dehalococcoidia bacterium]